LIAVLVASTLAASTHASAQTPPAPALEPLKGKWHAETYRLHGKIFLKKTELPGTFVRILRDATVIDSVSTASDSMFSVAVPVQPGNNRFTAVLVVPEDSTLATSPPSNVVDVIYDPSAGFFIPVPFTPGRAFALNVEDGANKVELRLFDVMGDLVMRFEDRTPRTDYSFFWDGFNASGERVRRGPLIAVVAIDHVDGRHEVIRRAFVVNPDQWSP
jgi:hypothetical protein